MESAAKNGTIYEFDGFRLVAGEQLLLRNGERIALNMKSFGVLKMLVERHGHLVTKSELIDTVWEDAFVEEGSLPKAIWMIRHALDDTSKERFIQTVPKRGYRFVFPVSIVTEGSGAFRLSELGVPVEDDKEIAAVPAGPVINGVAANAAAGILVNDAGKDPAKWFPRLAALAGIVFLLLSGVVLYLTFGRQDVVGGGGANRLAVMPLKPLDLQGRDTIYDLGIAEALISKLSADKNLTVRQFDSVRPYADADKDPVKAGIEQKVDYVLSAYYQLANGKIKVTAKLFEVASGNVVEYYATTVHVAEPFATQEAIANDIGNSLLATFGSDSSEFRPDRGTENLEAYRHYLIAQNFNELRGTENSRKALEHIERAVELDPNFGRAWATKAYIHRYMAYGADAVEQSLKSIEAVEKALSLDPNLSEAHSIRCKIKFRYEYDFVGAETACLRAIELDPKSPLAHKLYGNFLYTRGRFDEAIAEIMKAIDLQPVSYDNQQTYALALFYARRYAESEAQWKALLPLNPNHRFIYLWLIRTLARQGKEPEAFDYLITLMTLEKEGDETIRRFRTIYARSGWQGVTLERIRIAESGGNARPYDLARLYASINDKDNAFKYLARAYEERSTMIAVLGVDPELDPIRDDPRYADLIGRVEGR